jgi:hypothetical protein
MITFVKNMNMTTITIQKENRFIKTEFNSITELQEYILFIENNEVHKFSDEYKTDLDLREHDMINDPKLGIEFNEFKSKYLNGKDIQD